MTDWKRSDSICWLIVTLAGLMEYCAVGVAMGNGGEEIKAKADFVTDAVADDGLAHAFKRLGLI